MTLWTLILRSLRFHVRAHLGVVLGATVSGAVLIGALLVGDSVRASLRQMALTRLGGVEFALASGDRLFRSRLASDLSLTGAVTAPVLQLPGAARVPDGSARANRVQVLGVDTRFWELASARPSFATIPADGVVLNRPLAGQLNARLGDLLLLRVPKPTHLSRDAPLAPEEDTSVALRLTVHAIVEDAEFGRFSLLANQVAPFNAFVDLRQLQQRTGATNQANLLLVGKSAGAARAPRADQLAAAVRDSWQLADAALELRELPDTRTLELRTPRVFLDPPVLEAVRQAAPGAGEILTYFVNELRAGTNATPYSMVTAMGAPVVPADLRDDEILVNQWLADDLAAGPGDSITLTYYIVGAGRKLEERTNTFRIRAVLPMTPPAADRSLMPDFPGLTDADNCRDWDTGFPIKTSAIRDKDEKYWDDWRGTPKAFVTLAAGRAMWNNRFGETTAVRFQNAARDELTGKLLAALDPASVGLSFQPVRAQALAASEQAMDFGQLFLGFSFFLIVAALVLMALLFQFSIEQRAAEVGTLLALGFTPGRVRRLLLLEGLALSVLGALLGAAGATAYARGMLWGLSTVWRDAVSGSALSFHAQPVTVLIGIAASVCVALGTVWLALRNQAKQPARELLADGAGEEAQTSKLKGQRSAWTGWIAGLAVLLALALVGFALARGETASAGLFFGAGALLLIAALAASSGLLARLGLAGGASPTGLGSLGLRNATRRRKRSLATVAMLACGLFLVVAVEANRLDADRAATSRASGTGGFAFLGETSLPVVQDLNGAAGREFFGLSEAVMNGVSVVPFRVRDGDEASCLNLNRAQTPRVLGVNPALLGERKAFTFATLADGAVKEQPWQNLVRGSFYPADGKPLAEDEVAAIGDEASILWALGKKVGDAIDYTDERGRPFKLRLVASVANSILQGNLLIAEEEFVKRFPSESGYRFFLVDAPSERAGEVAATLTRALQDVGLELTPAARRLAQFNAVQNTYLSTFQVLGGLGLLLGSFGLAVVVLRNVLERRGELALLLAVGFRARAVKWLVVSEHGALLALGLLSGVLAALVAVLPRWLAAGVEKNYTTLVVTVLAVLVSGALWTWLAAALALRGPLLKALRNE
jgi:ABC-type antimicrobial peptide transport system permease subunit